MARLAAVVVLACAQGDEARLNRRSRLMASTPTDLVRSSQDAVAFTAALASLEEIVQMDVRVRALIWLVGGLVVHRESRQGRSSVSLPGGRVLEGEPLAAALRREVREELGVEVEVGPLRYVAEVVYGHAVHDLNLIFEATVSDRSSRARLVSMDPRSAEATDVRPPILHLVTGTQPAPEVAPQWLGNVWRPEA